MIIIFSKLITGYYVMRRSDTQKIDKIIDAYLRQTGVGKKLKEIELINSWEEVVGISVAKRTNNMYIKNKRLFVYIESSIVKNELMMLKDSLVNALNNKVKERVIEDIVLR